MRTFVVEGYVGRRGEAELAAAADRARAAVQEMARAGTPLRYLRVIFVPEDETCFHLFAAESPAVVREASLRAQLTVDRIVEARER